MVDYVKYENSKLKDKLYKFGKYSFSQIELKHLLISFFLIMLTIMIFTNKSGAFFSWGNFLKLFTINNLIAYSIAMGTGFILHEMGHKIVAQYYNFVSEFRADFTMQFYILLAVFFLPIILLAPGAVMILGRPSIRQNGIISVAGPVVNIFIAILFLILSFIFPPLSNSLWGNILYITFYLNLGLGFFNMLPFWVLDGKKVFLWNKQIYFLVMFIIIGLFLFGIKT